MLFTRLVFGRLTGFPPAEYVIGIPLGWKDRQATKSSNDFMHPLVSFPCRIRSRTC